MIIADIDYTEEVAELVTLEGGTGNNGGDLASLFQSLFQSLTIYPSSAAAVNNLGGTSIGNTAISFNISMPIMIVIGSLGEGTMRGHFRRTPYSGK